MNKLTATMMMALTIAATFFASCGESSKERAQREKIDSLETVAVQGQLDYQDLQSYLTIIATGLDSIAIEEGELLANNTPGENAAINRQRMKQNLDHTREILARHRDRINELEKKLSTAKGDASNLRTIITALREQLDTKDQELASLRADLEDSRKSVADLTNRVSRLSQVQQEQAGKLQEQEQTIAKQSEELATGFIKIGTKRELKDLGLLKGGFLKKNSVDFANIDQSLFERININQVTTFPVTDKAKVLTPVPADSYQIVNGELLVTNVKAFWSMSNYVIVQLD